MPTKTQALAQMAEHTATQITGNRTSWTGFLTTVGRLYKYPYYEQLMIYAQRSDATACAEYDLWNNKMNRYVRRGSKGIALIDPTGDTPKLRYVFDVSDTGGRENSCRPYLWKMKAEYETVVMERLAELYGESRGNLADDLYNIAEKLASEYYDYHNGDFPYLIPDSFLEDYDEDHVRVAFKSATTVSIAYTLMKRCGLNPDEYFEHEDFLSVFDFNTPDTATLLGTAVSEQSEQVFRQIAITIAKTERERRNEYERNDLQEERGLSDTRPYSDGAGTAGRRPPSDREIWETEEKLSPRTQNTIIQFPVTERETISAPVGDRQDSEQAAHTDNDRASADTESPRQDDTTDGMGGLHEQSQSPGRGIDTDGAYLQLSLFPTEAEQIQMIAESQKPFAFSIPQSDIDSILRTGGNRNNSHLNIVAHYQKDKSPEENAAFLWQEYGEGGKGFTIGGEKVSVWFNTDGIHLAKGETALHARSKQHIPWEEAGQRISELLA